MASFESRKNFLGFRNRLDQRVQERLLSGRDQRVFLAFGEEHFFPKLGLWRRHGSEADFALWARMPALAFVPPAALENALSELAPDLPLE